MTPTRMTTAAPRPTLAPLLLDYFTATDPAAIDDAVEAITDFLDSTPPTDETLALMLRACSASPMLNLAMRTYAHRP